MNNFTDIAAVPPNAVPVPVTFSGSEYVVLDMHIFSHQARLIPPGTLHEFLTKRSLWQHLLLANIQFCQEQEFYLQLEQQKPMLVVSDGGTCYKDVKASYVWVIPTFSGDPLITNRGTCYGHEMDSFWAEAYGALSVFAFFCAIWNFHSLAPSAILHGCNNQLVIWWLKRHAKKGHPERTTVPHWDLTFFMSVLVQELPSRVTHQHVRGHQDDTNPHDLDDLAQLNIQADALASLALTQAHTHITVLFCPLSQVQLSLGKNTILQHLMSAVQKQFAIRSLLLYWQEKLALSPQCASTNNWELILACMGPHWKIKRFLIQFLADRLPTNQVILKYNPHYLGTCPTCGALETQRHFLECPALNNNLKIQTYKFQKLFPSYHLPEWLYQSLLQSLHKWTKPVLVLGSSSLFPTCTPMLGIFPCLVRIDLHSHYQNNQLCISAIATLKTILSFWWSWVHKNWTDRCQAFHSSTHGTSKKLYYLQHALLHKIKAFRPINSLQHMPLPQLTKILCNLKPSPATSQAHAWPYDNNKYATKPPAPHLAGTHIGQHFLPTKPKPTSLQ